jgi:hypothetical protein
MIMMSDRVAATLEELYRPVGKETSAQELVPASLACLDLTTIQRYTTIWRNLLLNDWRFLLQKM